MLEIVGVVQFLVSTARQSLLLNFVENIWYVLHGYVSIVVINFWLY